MNCQKNTKKLPKNIFWLEEYKLSANNYLELKEYKNISADSWKMKWPWFLLAESLHFVWIVFLFKLMFIL